MSLLDKSFNIAGRVIGRVAKETGSTLGHMTSVAGRGSAEGFALAGGGKALDRLTGPNIASRVRSVGDRIGETEMARRAGQFKSAGGAALNKLEDAVVGSMIKKTDSDFYNGYTGLKPGAGLNVAAFGAAGAYAYGVSLNVHTKPEVGSVEYQDQAAIMSADGMGRSNAPTLGSSGSLVFGLNAMRRG